MGHAVRRSNAIVADISEGIRAGWDYGVDQALESRLGWVLDAGADLVSNAALQRAIEQTNALGLVPQINFITINVPLLRFRESGRRALDAYLGIDVHRGRVDIVDKRRNPSWIRYALLGRFPYDSVAAQRDLKSRAASLYTFDQSKHQKVRWATEAEITSSVESSGAYTIELLRTVHAINGLDSPW